MAVFVLIYTGQKIALMANFENDVVIRTEYDVFSDREMFQIPKIAFGLTSLHPDGENDHNHDYGKIKFYREYWNETDIMLTEIVTRNCTQAEFGFNGTDEEQVFYDGIPGK